MHCISGTVRSNILFGQPYDRERYRQVVKKCALERDFSLLPNGDRTIVGERGASLSGGQKARIGLARACYRKAAIYLLGMKRRINKYWNFSGLKNTMLVRHGVPGYSDTKHINVSVASIPSNSHNFVFAIHF